MTDSKKKTTVKSTSKKRQPVVGKKKRHTPYYEYVVKWLTENKASQKMINGWEKDEVKLTKFMKLQEKKLQAKKTKDPNHPKRPLSAYMVYCQQNREAVKKDDPEVKVIMKKLGAGWRVLSAEEKIPYNKEAARLKEIYNKEMENYIPLDGKKIDKDKPKKPWSNYFFFCDEKRAKLKEENPLLKATEILKELGEMWGKLSIEEKIPYNKMAAKAKTAYLKAMDAYNKKKENEIPKTKEEEAPPKKGIKKEPKKETKKPKKKVPVNHESEEEIDED